LALEYVLYVENIYWGHLIAKIHNLDCCWKLKWFYFKIHACNDLADLVGYSIYQFYYHAQLFDLNYWISLYIGNEQVKLFNLFEQVLAK